MNTAVTMQSTWTPLLGSCWAEGVPVQQGSMNRARTGRLYHSKGPALDRWRKAIADAWRLHEHNGYAPDGGVRVQLEFWLPQPARLVRPVPSVRPDLDKYVRAALDALTGVAYKDDGQVVHINASKQYVVGLVTPGVRVAVWRVA